MAAEDQEDPLSAQPREYCSDSGRKFNSAEVMEVKCPIKERPAFGSQNESKKADEVG
jgi:hypothetical protein